ncbi:MAG: hypothetical protein KDD06_24635, partial [Phaeodactylibacter sp.]|nr:hypothetical protein [Phaeodactylibacter sp.]
IGVKCKSVKVDRWKSARESRERCIREELLHLYTLTLLHFIPPDAFAAGPEINIQEHLKNKFDASELGPAWSLI